MKILIDLLMCVSSEDSGETTLLGIYVCHSLTLYLQVSCADNYCKQIGLRSGSTKCRAWSGSNLFDTQDGIPVRI